MRRKLTTFIVSTCLIIGLLPTTVFAQSNSNEQVDLTISSSEELQEFAREVASGNTYEGKIVKLTKDIKFDKSIRNNFTSIGRVYCMFSGTFDGAGYTISGIFQDLQSEYGGLFGYIGEKGIVKNVTLKDSLIRSVTNGGGIAFQNFGMIENCHNKANISGFRVGGIVWENKLGGTILNCSNSGTIMDAVDFGETTDIVGGIASYNSGTIANSYNTGKVTSKIDGFTKMGGIVGINHHEHLSEYGTIKNCYNVGTVKSGIGVVEEMSGMIQNVFYSKESVAPGKTYNRVGKKLTEKKMRTTSFVSILNKNRKNKTSWSKWELNKSSKYPTFAKKYEVTFNESELGYTKTNLSYAYRGQTVTLTAVPNENYKTSIITVKTVVGKKVNVKNINGKYQFTMPNSKVIVTTTFN